MNIDNSKPLSVINEDDDFDTPLIDIVMSFVDIGFGSSSAALSLRSEKSNRAIRAAAEDFVCRKG